MDGSTAGDVVRVRVPLRASPMLAGLIGAVHLGAGVALAASDVAFWAQPCLGAMIAISAWRALTEHGLRVGPRAVTELLLASSAPGSAGCWRVMRADGSQTDVRLSDVTYRHPQLVCLRFEDASGKVPAGKDWSWRYLARAITSLNIAVHGVTVVIPGDATTPAAHRRLRVAIGNSHAL